MGPRTNVDARGASSIYIKTAFLNSSQNHGPYLNTGIICLCVCYIDHVFSRFYFSLRDGNTRVCIRFSLFTPYRTCIKGMQAILPQLQHGLYPVCRMRLSVSTCSKLHRMLMICWALSCIKYFTMLTVDDIIRHDWNVFKQIETN